MGNDEGATSSALGISLTAEHGIIAIRHPDGTFSDLGRIDGDEQYIGMMKRLSSPNSQHPRFVARAVHYCIS